MYRSLGGEGDGFLISISLNKFLEHNFIIVFPSNITDVFEKSLSLSDSEINRS
jgi:hypothetical protein